MLLQQKCYVVFWYAERTKFSIRNSHIAEAYSMYYSNDRWEVWRLEWGVSRDGEAWWQTCGNKIIYCIWYITMWLYLSVCIAQCMKLCGILHSIWKGRWTNGKLDPFNVVMKHWQFLTEVVCSLCKSQDLTPCITRHSETFCGSMKFVQGLLTLSLGLKVHLC